MAKDRRLPFLPFQDADSSTHKRNIRGNSQENSGIVSHISVNTAVSFKVILPSTEITEATGDWIAASDFPFGVDFTPASNFNFMSIAFTENLGRIGAYTDSNVPYLLNML